MEKENVWQLWDDTGKVGEALVTYSEMKKAVNNDPRMTMYGENTVTGSEYEGEEN